MLSNAMRSPLKMSSACLSSVFTQATRLTTSPRESWSSCVQGILTYLTSLPITFVRFAIAGWSTFSEACMATNNDFMSLDKEHYVTVPQMWLPDATKLMATACQRAGFENVELVQEPQSAAAFTLQGMLEEGQQWMRFQNLLQTIQPGDVMLVADVGGGTGVSSARNDPRCRRMLTDAGLRVIPVGATSPRWSIEEIQGHWNAVR